MRASRSAASGWPSVQEPKKGQCEEDHGLLGMAGTALVACASIVTDS